jgi:hypothetical protein
MKKVFKFSVNSAPLPNLKPAIKYVPDWYRKAERWLGGKPEIKNYASNRGMKNCIPILDSLTSGYMIETWCDIQVKKVLLEDGTEDTQVTWMVPPDPVKVRRVELNPTFPVPAGHNNKLHFVWVLPWFMKLPQGYSAYVGHPLNRFDLPFTTCSGIVDLDGGLGSDANLPFFLKDDFEGIIPTGTPIVQIIPIKRESWKSENDPSIIENIENNKYYSNRLINGYYKHNLWHKKEYN